MNKYGWRMGGGEWIGWEGGTATSPKQTAAHPTVTWLCSTDHLKLYCECCLYLSDDKGQKFTETGNFSSTAVVISHQSSEDIQTHTEYGRVPTSRMTSSFKIAGHLEVISHYGGKGGARKPKYLGENLKPRPANRYRIPTRDPNPWAQWWQASVF